MRVTWGFYVGLYMCVDVVVTAKQAHGIRRVLKSCCLPAHMPVMLEVFMTHLEPYHAVTMPALIEAKRVPAAGRLVRGHRVRKSLP